MRIINNKCLCEFSSCCFKRSNLIFYQIVKCLRLLRENIFERVLATTLINLQNSKKTITNPASSRLPASLGLRRDR